MEYDCILQQRPERKLIAPGAKKPKRAFEKAYNVRERDNAHNKPSYECWSTVKEYGRKLQYSII